MNNFYNNTSVVILCGGKGERLRPLTTKMPKPLIKIKDKPILSYLINDIKKFGFKHFIIAVGYKSNQIIKYFKENHKTDNIKIIDSGNVDILTRLIECKNITNNNILLCYGDTLANINFNRYIKFHQNHKGLSSVISYQLRSKFGILDIDKKNLVLSFFEKPLLNHWLNIGYFYFDRKVLNNLKKYKSFEKFIQYLIENSQMYSYKHKGLHITVNSVTELQEAEKNIDDFLSLKH